MNYGMFSNFHWFPVRTISLLALLFISIAGFCVDASVPVVSVGKLLDPFDPNVTWQVSAGETSLKAIWEYLNHNKWVISKTYDEFSKAVISSNQGINIDALTVGQSIKLVGTLKLSTQKQKQDCLRQILLDQTGIKCDSNPLYAVSLNPDRVQIVNAAAPNGNGIAVSTLLALWQKEGSLQKVTTWTSTKVNSDAAKTEAREHIYYGRLGMDHFCNVAYNAEVQDNVLVDDTTASAMHFSTEASKYGGPTVPTAILAELTATVIANNGGNQISASDNFFVLSLGLGARFFQSLLVPEGPDITYIHWNVRAATWQAMVNSINTNPDRKALGFVNWAIHSPVIQGQYYDPRRNAIRFYFYRRCFSQYDPP